MSTGKQQLSTRQWIIGKISMLKGTALLVRAEENQCVLCLLLTELWDAKTGIQVILLAAVLSSENFVQNTTRGRVFLPCSQAHQIPSSPVTPNRTAVWATGLYCHEKHCFVSVLWPLKEMGCMTSWVSQSLQKKKKLFTQCKTDSLLSSWSNSKQHLVTFTKNENFLRGMFCFKRPRIPNAFIYGTEKPALFCVSLWFRWEWTRSARQAPSFCWCYQKHVLS